MGADDLTTFLDRKRAIQTAAEKGQVDASVVIEILAALAARHEIKIERLLAMLREQATERAPKRKRTTKEKTHGK